MSLFLAFGCYTSTNSQDAVTYPGASSHCQAPGHGTTLMFVRIFVGVSVKTSGIPGPITWLGGKTQDLELSVL